MNRTRQQNGSLADGCVNRPLRHDLLVGAARRANGEPVSRMKQKKTTVAVTDRHRRSDSDQPEREERERER